MRPALFICLLAASFAFAADAPALPKPQVALALLAEHDAAVPGSTLTVALHLTHAPGWHTYWRNPGTLGLPTSIKWSLPPGYTAGPIQWQRPQLTTMAAYTVWGYEGDALLLTDIAVPSDAPLDADVTLTATVTYMGCEKNCCPDEAKLTLTLPVRRAAKPIADRPAKFDAVRRDQPVTTDAWQVAVARTPGNGEHYTITLTPTDASKVNPAVDSLRFFGYDRVISSNEPQHFRRDGDTLVLTLRREVHTPDEQPNRLRGILVCPNGLLPNDAAPVIAIDAPIVGG